MSPVGKIYFSERETIDMSEEIILTPTEELYKEIFIELPEHDIDERDIPELLGLLDTIILSSEAKAIKMRLGLGCDKHTFQAIGEEFDLSAERIRQIVLKAFRRLRHPSRSKRIKLLFVSPAELREQIKELQDRAYRLSGEVAKLKSERSAIQRNLKHCAACSSLFIEERCATPDERVTIEEMDFTVRTFHCLKRANINTLADLVERTRKDLRKIRNFGGKNLEEVERKMTELGIQLQDDDYEQ
jgi:hypothetical protein